MSSWLSGAGTNKDKPKDTNVNPFVGMYVYARIMMEAYKEDKYRTAGISLPKEIGRSRTSGPRRPAGAKLLRKMQEHRFVSYN